MKKIIALTTFAILSLPAHAVDETAAMELAKKSGCIACHTTDKKLLGPAWKDVAKKYAGDSAASEQLALKIKKGTKGTWGPIPMPPNPTIKDGDIKTMVEFILSLK